MSTTIAPSKTDGTSAKSIPRFRMLRRFLASFHSNRTVAWPSAQRIADYGSIVLLTGAKAAFRRDIRGPPSISPPAASPHSLGDPRFSEPGPCLLGVGLGVRDVALNLLLHRLTVAILAQERLRRTFKEVAAVLDGPATHPLHVAQQVVPPANADLCRSAQFSTSIPAIILPQVQQPCVPRIAPQPVPLARVGFLHDAKTPKVTGLNNSARVGRLHPRG